MVNLSNLKVDLAKRRTRLYDAGYFSYHSELRYFLQFLHQNHYTRSLIDILLVCPTVSIDEWREKAVKGRVEFPSSEEERAAVCYGLLTRCQHEERNETALKLGFVFGQGAYSNPETALGPIIRKFTETIVYPFIDYINDQIDDIGNVLYMLERFKVKAEWFRRESLYSLYTSNTTVGEVNLDQELRANLFDGGVDYPFSQPSSPSGKADVVALLGSDDPLVLEVKVFDPNRKKGKSHLRQGFHQVFKYAGDYNQEVGYLVIFNCSNGPLVISPDDASEPEIPPRITYGGKTFFVIVVDIKPSKIGASKENTGKRVTIGYREFTGE